MQFPPDFAHRTVTIWRITLALFVVFVLAGCSDARPTPIGQTLLAQKTAQAESASSSTGMTVTPEPGAAAGTQMNEASENVTSSESTGGGSTAQAASQPVVAENVQVEAAGGSTEASTAETPETVQVAAAPSATPDLRPLSQTTNVLILGSDRRPNTPNWRTDVVMVVAMDMARGEAGVISIPRDVYLPEIPGHQPNKINVVDYLGEQDEPGGGGPKLLASLIQEHLGIPIHYYLRFDFNSFEEVIDALGGIDLPLDCPVYEYLPKEQMYLNLKPGVHRLTGYQALVYVRSRRLGGDLERARRQQRVVWAVRNQILAENMLPKVPALYAALKDAVQTDIDLVTAIRFVRFALQLQEEDVHGMVLSPPDLLQEGWRRGMFVFVADWDKISERVQTVFDRPPLIETNTVGETGDRQQCP